MRQTKIWFSLAAMFVAGQFLPAYASTTTYPTRAAWLAAVGSATTETFETVPLQVVPVTGGTILTPFFDVVVDQNHGSIAIRSSGSVNGSRELYVDAHGASIPFFHRLNFHQPIQSFAADLAEINEGGLLNVSLAGGTFAFPNNSTFFGVVSTVPFSSVEVRTTGSIAEFYAMDNVSFKNAVPEPTSLLLFVTGLMGAVSCIRRRSKC